MKLPAIVTLACGATLLFVVLIGFVALPKLVTSKIKKQLALKPGSDIRKLYLKVPFAIDFKIYVFNVTNAAEAAQGDSPVLDEIGPYYFEEWKEKVDVSDNETEDSLTYHNKITWIFRSDLSAPGLTGEEIITIPHPVIVGIAVTIARDRPTMLSMISKALKSIFKNPETPFLTAPVMDILFRGIEIDCAVNDFAGKAVCSQLKTNPTDFERVSDTLYKFSFFGMVGYNCDSNMVGRKITSDIKLLDNGNTDPYRKNGTVDPKTLTVKRGIRDYRELGHVIEYDGKREMSAWTTKECNQYVGTDSTIFPPFLKKEDGVGAFAPELCRSIVATFDKPEDYYGIKVSRFTATFGDMSTIEEQKCYCPTPTTCWKKGVHDLTKCIGAPIVASLPHFYAGHDDYIHGVRGLHPNEHDHGIELIFESMTGTPVFGKKRLQFNIPFMPIEKIDCMKNVGEYLAPLIWVEEGASLPDEFRNELVGVFRMFRRIEIIKWMLVIASASASVVGIICYYKQRDSVPITPVRMVKPIQEIQNDIEVVKNGNKGPDRYNDKY